MALLQTKLLEALKIWVNSTGIMDDAVVGQFHTEVYEPQEAQIDFQRCFDGAMLNRGCTRSVTESQLVDQLDEWRLSLYTDDLLDAESSEDQVEANKLINKDSQLNQFDETPEHQPVRYLGRRCESVASVRKDIRQMLVSKDQRFRSDVVNIVWMRTGLMFINGLVELGKAFVVCGKYQPSKVRNASGIRPSGRQTQVCLGRCQFDITTRI